MAEGLRLSGYSVDEIDVVRTELELPTSTEAVFIALHGAFGEDGQVQALLAQQGIPFTGSSAASCRTSFDKIMTRSTLARSGIPVAKGVVIESADQLVPSFPVVAKPPCEGSSLGCHFVRDATHWKAAFDDASKYDRRLLVEHYIPGRELTVGIVGQQTLPVIEIIPEGDWYDFEAKYHGSSTTYVVPANLGGELARRLQSMALSVFHVLGASGFARVDFRLTPENEPVVLELNAIPGFTANSLLPKAARAAGLEFKDLCSQIMENIPE